ncbi:MAG: metallophosphoesterase [Veillonellaceae bacterium]|nr:metallophosphoesterase [Veillonellaceae bacterium]
MSIYALADLHLSGNPPTKPMDRFSPAWENHWEKVRQSWLNLIQPEDTVLIAGDTSWAMKWKEALVDLAAIAELPGQKILVRGNHDYWWGTVGKMAQESPASLYFLHNNFFRAEGWGICGSRGWLTPCDPFFKPEDEPVYRREVSRLRTSLVAAHAGGCNRIIVMLHYPPIYLEECDNGFTDLLAEYEVEYCVFGHIHGDGAHMAPRGQIKSAACHLVACDAINFEPKKII